MNVCCCNHILTYPLHQIMLILCKNFTPHNNLKYKEQPIAPATKDNNVYNKKKIIYKITKRVKSRE